MRHMPINIGTLHFVGIGGIGMSGIAEILHDSGYQVQGSDMAENANVQRLRKKGILVHVGHDAGHLVDQGGEEVAVVVISSAVKNDNPELKAARAQGLPVVRRAEMLAELMRLRWSIAIGGTHGKTTTTSIVGTMLEEGGCDPTVINGGIVNRYGTNIRLGQGDWLVAEADESDGTFTRLPATICVVTNIDPEHMESYSGFDGVRRAYQQFVENIPFYGFGVLCADHDEVLSLKARVPDRRIVTYGFSPQADVRAVNVQTDVDGSRFDVVFSAWLHGEEEEHLKDVYLSMPGEHNVQNALSAIAIAYEMGIAFPLMKNALSGFAGVKRRFTKTGEVNDILVIDDYGHHPVEIEAVLKTARISAEKRGGNLIAVMQPHRFSRLHDLFDDFCTCFTQADSVLITDVYRAGEEPIAGADKDALVDGIRKHGHRDVNCLDDIKKLPQFIAEIGKPNDIVVCLGAGDITTHANALPQALTEIYDAEKKRA